MAMRPVGRGGRQPSRAATLSHKGFGGGVQAVYEDLTPISEWQQDKDSDILLIYLPGFQKQNLRISVEGREILRARGERLNTANKWSRFQEDYKIPERCDNSAIRARYDRGILAITLPWKKEYMHQHQTLQEAPPIPPPPPPPFPEEVPPMQTTPSPSPVAPKVESTTTIVKAPKELEDKFKEDTEGLDQPKKYVPQKGSNDDNPSEVTSPLPLPNFGGSLGKPKDEKLNSVQPYDPLFQKGEDHKQKKQSLLPDLPVQETTPAISMTENIGDIVRKKNESTSEMKKKYTEYENLKRSKEEEEKYAADDKMKTGSRKKKKEGLTDRGAEHTAEGSEKPITASTLVAPRTDNRLRNYKEVIRNLAQLNEERQLLLNVGAAMLVIVALGTYIITSTVASGEPN